MFFSLFSFLVLFRFFKIKKSSVLCSCFCIRFGKAYRKGSGDFGVDKGISPYLVISLSACVASECLHVRACTYGCASCALGLKSTGASLRWLEHFFCIYQARKDGRAVFLRSKWLFRIKPYSLSFLCFKPIVYVHK